jgi:hypothetical protein
VRRPKHSYFIDKATEAVVSAIEVYNKPGFRYREETFSILTLNAWELSLKARILKENKNSLRSIEVWERKPTKSSSPSKKLTPKRNPSRKCYDNWGKHCRGNCSSVCKGCNRRILRRKYPARADSDQVKA